MTDTRKAGQRKASKRKPQTGKKGLSEKQQRFCEEYIVDLNATQAATRAGYSEKTAYSIGQRLLKKVECQTCIAELMQERSERTQITADKVLLELAAVGFTNFSDLASWSDDGLTLTPSGELTPEQAKSVQSVKFKRTVTPTELGESERIEMEIKQHGKLEALEKIGRHLGMFTSKVQVSGPDGGAIKTENATVQAEVKPEDLEGLTADELSKKYFAKK